MDEKDFSKRAEMLMSHQDADQRLQPRTPSHQMITIQTDGRSFPAYLRDISNTGAFLFTGVRAYEGMNITLVLSKPGSGEKTVIQAEVVRVEDQQSSELKGVAFKFGESKLKTN